MKKTILFGASDDLLEFRGALYEEWGSNSGEKGYIAFSDGTILDYKYDGEWKFQVRRQGALFEKIIISVGEDNEHKDFSEYDPTSYSDIAVFKEGITWSAHASEVLFS